MVFPCLPCRLSLRLRLALHNGALWFLGPMMVSGPRCGGDFHFKFEQLPVRILSRVLIRVVFSRSSPVENPELFARQQVSPCPVPATFPEEALQRRNQLWASSPREREREESEKRARQGRREKRESAPSPNTSPQHVRRKKPHAPADAADAEGRTLPFAPREPTKEATTMSSERRHQSRGYGTDDAVGIGNYNSLFKASRKDGGGSSTASEKVRRSRPSTRDRATASIRAPHLSGDPQQPLPRGASLFRARLPFC